MKNKHERVPLIRVWLLAVAAPLSLSISPGLAQQGKATNEQRVHGAIARVPEKDRTRRNPLEGDPDATASGGKLFEQHCAECHGKKAEGTKRAPSLLGRDIQQATPGALFWVVTNGEVRRGMPVWSKLPEPERWQIVTFLKSWKAEQNDKEGGR